MISPNPIFRKSLQNPSLWALVFSNILTIFLAVYNSWNVQEVLWVYWFQSVIIGIFNFVRILQLKEFSTEDFKINDRPVKPTKRTKNFTAFFFLFHYSFFHLVYAVFLLTGFSNFFAISSQSVHTALNWSTIFFTTGLFFITHLFSYVYNRPRNIKKPNIGTLMFYPYARIVPMHIIIIAGSFLSQAMLPIFLVLRMFSDIGMHTIEHEFIRKETEPNIPISIK
jgi:Family of unknown function (DUF6498)